MSRRPQSMHESFDRDAVRLGSDRSFGFVFFVVFSVAGFIFRESSASWFWYAAATFLLIIALAAPRLLRPANKLWFLFGMALGRVTTPIVMGIIFYLVVTPTGLIFRALGKDPLRLRIDKAATTYWIERRPPGPDPKSMNQQF
jgi:hypothetical protein